MLENNSHKALCFQLFVCFPVLRYCFWRLHASISLECLWEKFLSGDDVKRRHWKPLQAFCRLKIPSWRDFKGEKHHLTKNHCSDFENSHTFLDGSLSLFFDYFMPNGLFCCALRRSSSLQLFLPNMTSLSLIVKRKKVLYILFSCEFPMLPLLWILLLQPLF